MPPRNIVKQQAPEPYYHVYDSRGRALFVLPCRNEWRS